MTDKSGDKDGVSLTQQVMMLVNMLLEDVNEEPGRLHRAMEIAERDIVPLLTEAARSSSTPIDVIGTFQSQWNKALETAAQVVDECNREGPYNAVGAACRIRALMNHAPLPEYAPSTNAAADSTQPPKVASPVMGTPPAAAPSEGQTPALQAIRDCVRIGIHGEWVVMFGDVHDREDVKLKWDAALKSAAPESAKLEICPCGDFRRLTSMDCGREDCPNAPLPESAPSTNAAGQAPEATVETDGHVLPAPAAPSEGPTPRMDAAWQDELHGNGGAVHSEGCRLERELRQAQVSLNAPSFATESRTPKVPQWLTSWPEWFGMEPLADVTVVPKQDYDKLESALAEAQRSSTAPSLEAILSGIRSTFLVDDNGDPVGPQPDAGAGWKTGWETGYSAGIRTVYRMFKAQRSARRDNSEG